MQNTMVVMGWPKGASPEGRQKIEKIMPTQAKILVTHQSGLKCFEDCIFLVYKSKKILIVRRPAGGKWISKVGWG